MTVLRGLPTWRTSYQIENPKIPTHLHFDATRFRHPISPSMDELNRLADDYEWFLQANALGVIKRKPDLADREASFQPRGQYLFEVEPGSGEWLQIGNEFAIRSNGLPPYYREQVIAAVQHRMGALGPNQLTLLAALMRHYQQRVYEPKLEVDETGAQLPSPSLPNITARRLYEDWFKRARSMNPELATRDIDAASASMLQWTELVPNSASDAYSWEVERPVDKRVIKLDYLISEAEAARALQERPVTPPLPMAVGVAPALSRFKLFLNGAQHGPYTVDEIALRSARGEIDPGTKVWNMQWNPKSDKWKAAGDMPELSGLFDSTIPDPDNDIPDPE